jgi:hypothetical protein
MKPTHDDLCAAIMAIGAQYCAIEAIEHETLHRMAELGLAQWNSDDATWELTAAAKKLLPSLMDGDEIERLG